MSSIKREIRHFHVVVVQKRERNEQKTGASNENFRKNICSEDDLRSRIFGTFVVEFSCLPASPSIFEHLKYGIIAYF